MALKGKLVLHPAEFSPEVIEAGRRLLPTYRDLIPGGLFDPYAGRGVRSGALADELGMTFRGIDIETWQDADPRVAQGDARDPLAYPAGDDWAVFTSPPYTNRISTDYVSGPTPQTKTNGRRAYGVSLGRPLDPLNIARFAKPGSPTFYSAFGRSMKNWAGQLALVNVDLPMAWLTREQMIAAGFDVVDVVEVQTRRYRGVTGSDKRAPHEVILVGLR